MQPANNFIVLNIREYLENEDKRLGEDTLVQLLSEFSCPYNLAAYLIAQLGKNFNDRVKGRITGQELLEAAIRQTQLLHYQAGGMVAFVEADNKDRLL